VLYNFERFFSPPRWRAQSQQGNVEGWAMRYGAPGARRKRSTRSTARTGRGGSWATAVFQQYASSFGVGLGPGRVRELAGQRWTVPALDFVAPVFK